MNFAVDVQIAEVKIVSEKDKSPAWNVFEKTLVALKTENEDYYLAASLGMPIYIFSNKM